MLMGYQPHEKSHDGRRYTPRDRQGHEPGKDDVPEDGPINVLTCTETADKDDAANFTVSRADGNSNIGGHEDGQRRANLNAESTENTNKRYSYFSVHLCWR